MYKVFKNSIFMKSEKKIFVDSFNVDVCDCYIYVCLLYIYEVWKE